MHFTLTRGGATVPVCNGGKAVMMFRSKNAKRRLNAVLIAAILFFSPSGTLAFEGNLAPEIGARTGDYSPFVGRAYPDQVLFGDLHFHTKLSFDAGLVGTSLSVHDAFRVARGEKIISNTGQSVQLIRPLDFLAITEHAEFLGVATALKGSDPRLLGNEAGRRIYDQFNVG